MICIQGVDLASKFGASVSQTGGQIDSEFSTADMSPYDVARQVAASAHEAHWTLIEDVPYGIKGQFQTKAVTRLQGMIIFALLDAGVDLSKVAFVNPSTWQRNYPGVASGEKTAREAAARRAAAERGYTPPPLVDNWIEVCEAEGKRVLKKDTNPLAKSETDFIDAFLIGDWASKFDSFSDILELSGVQPVMI